MDNRQISHSGAFQKIYADNFPTRRWKAFLRYELHTVTSFQKKSLEGSLEWGRCFTVKRADETNDQG